VYIYPISLLYTTQKPLKRVHIEEIGGEQEPPPTSSSQGPPAAEETLTQKQTKTANSQSMHIDPKSNSTTSESNVKVIELETPSVNKEQPSNHDHTVPLITEDSASSSGVEISARSEDKGTRIEVVKETQNCSTAGNGTTLPADVSDQGRQRNVVIPDVPDTSLQFQADWKRLRRDTNALTTFFKVCVFM
jgi:hypothetical protein